MALNNPMAQGMLNMNAMAAAQVYGPGVMGSVGNALTPTDPVQRAVNDIVRAIDRYPDPWNNKTHVDILEGMKAGAKHHAAMVTVLEYFAGQQAIDIFSGTENPTEAKQIYERIFTEGLRVLMTVGKAQLTK